MMMLMVLLSGCASPTDRQIFWDSQRVEWKLERQRLDEIYSKAFTRGFLEAWAGRHSIACRFDTSDDPEGDFAADHGYMDGQRAGSRARLDFEIEQDKKVRQ